MIDSTTISAGWTALKTAKDLFDGYVGGKADKESRERIGQALEQLGTVQDTLFALREELSRLQDENRDLKKQIHEAESWEKQLADYELFKTEGEGMVYRSKTEPVHYICPSCVNDQRIQILQDQKGYAGIFTCPGCDAKYNVNKKQKVPAMNRNRSEFW